MKKGAPRTVCAQALSTALLPALVGPFYEAAEQASRARWERREGSSSSKRRRAPPAHFGIAILESTECAIEDVFDGRSKHVAVGWIPKRDLGRYAEACMARHADADCARELAATLQDWATREDAIAAEQLPLVVAYRHREDAHSKVYKGGFAMLHCCVRRHPRATLATVLHAAGMRTAQALSLQLPSCELTLHDLDQANFATFVQPGAPPGADSEEPLDAAPHADPSDSSSSQSRSCASCGDRKPKEAFSKAQLKKKAKAKCAACAERGEPLLEARIDGKALASGCEALEDAMMEKMRSMGAAGGDDDATRARFKAMDRRIEVERRSAVSDLGTRLQKWIISFHSFLSGFAAVKFEQHGKGALFCFVTTATSNDSRAICDSRWFLRVVETVSGEDDRDCSGEP